MNYFNKNLEKLIEKETIEKISEKTGVSKDVIKNCINQNQDNVSLDFLTKLIEEFNVNIDEFLTCETISAEIHSVEKENSNRFIGNYICYYFNNSKNKKDQGRDLNFGIMSIVPVGEKLKVYLSFFKERITAEENFLKLTEGKYTVQEIEKIHRDITENRYIGELKCSNENAFINVTCREKDDIASIIFNNPNTKTNYIGGIATVNSISRGSDHNPCMQLMLISQKIINRSNESITDFLLNDNFDIRRINYSLIGDKIARLNKLMNEELFVNLTSETKKNLISEVLNDELRMTIKNDICRFSKVTTSRDAAFYEFLKKEVG